MTNVFLSYAQEDSAVARLVVEELRSARTEVFYFEDDAVRGQKFIELIQDEISRAELFVVLVSPDYLGSYWCRAELQMAMVRERQLCRQFVYAFHAVDTSPADAGFLGTVDWIDLRAPVDEAKLRYAVARLAPRQQRPAQLPQVDGKPLPKFHSRIDEITRLVNTLTAAEGDDLWLVLGPPRMGKSWFLQRLQFELGQKDKNSRSRLVDLRAYPVDMCSDWARLLCVLLNVEPPTSGILTAKDEREIAKELRRRSCHQLCLVDSAELMTQSCVEHFRRAVTSIYDHLGQFSNTTTRLSVVVASRREFGWRGYGRHGSSRLFKILPLAELATSVVRQAVRELDHQFGDNELEQWADVLRALSEGLPALLIEGLRWAQENEFQVQYADDAAFGAVARSYIANDLLVEEDLLPANEEKSVERKALLERALRAIAPYRLFTLSHLNYHLADNREFTQDLAAAEWSMHELWEALGRTALIQPNEDMWNQLNPPIRRLLFRYYYPDPAARIHAHMNARRFYNGWIGRTSGIEWCVGLVECLWHDAAVLSHERPDELSRLFPVRAAELAMSFVGSVDRPMAELREYLYERLIGDSELATLLGSEKLILDLLAESAGRMPAAVVAYIPRVEAELIRAQVMRVRSDRTSRVVLLYGVGGVGKTRLVRALAAEPHDDATIRWVTPVDVDDSNFWLIENLQRMVAEQVDPANRYFEKFLNHLARLPKYVVGPVGRDTVASHHRRIREAFVECYGRFVSETGSTVVLTLDTVETIRSMYLLLSLTQMINELPATLFVLSGRPIRGWEDKDTIVEYLQDSRTGPETVEIQLEGFRPDDAMRFLDASVLGELLEVADKRRLVELTDGHPLWLALAVDYLRQFGPPSEMTGGAESAERAREDFRRRLVTPYRSTEFWPESIKRLAVVRHNVDQQVWRTLMDDRNLPPDIATWDQAWRQLRSQPWIRSRANDRYVTLHDAFAEELALRLIPLHDQDETWRQGLWSTATRAYDTLVGSEPTQVRQQLTEIFHGGTEPDDTALQRVRDLDTRKRELDQLRAASLHYLLLSDFQRGIDQFNAQFVEAVDQDDLQFQELLCHELERFLPPVGNARPQRDAVGVVVDRFRAWLVDQPDRYIRISLNIARFLIQNSQPRAALNLLNRLPDHDVEMELGCRLANERGNAWMRIPGEVSKARQYFDVAREQAGKLPTPLRERRLAQACKELGFYSRNIGDWPEADHQYWLASEFIGSVVGPRQSDTHREELASILTNWAYLKALQGQYNEARSLAASALATRRKLGRDRAVAVSLNVAGEVHRYERLFEDAWNYYHEAEAMFVRLGDWPWIGLVLQEQAVCLVQMHDAGHDLVDDPVNEAKSLILRAIDICRDQAIRSYPPALNRAGRIFGRDDPDRGLSYLSTAIEEARRVADGWFLSASLIEYLELSYQAWIETADPRYRNLIDARVPEVESVLVEYRFHDCHWRWDLLRGHIKVRDFLAHGNIDVLSDAVLRYANGFKLLVDRRTGSYGRNALTSEFDKLQYLFVQLPQPVQAAWYATLRQHWTGLTPDQRTLLLAQLERLY